MMKASRKKTFDTIIALKPVVWINDATDRI
ncbi:hypothetical protein CLFO_29590 [Clostridium formicaceticum]|uniref:Uncharacterized protein n=1 Tax=Clostridium formicaceticum TaxID=1497 RepID=A0AAC9RPD8_9CLOT|nr:hypothetical protein CLFO_29590 [Clostridium formicaceticum]